LSDGFLAQLSGLSTNLLVGIAGIFSVSQAAVFGVGAYIVAYLLMNDIVSFLPAMVIASALCVLLNILVTLPALRVSGDYFVVTSFGIQLLATAVFTNWTAGTGGANGLPGIPPADLFGKTLDDNTQMAELSVTAMVLGCVAFWLIMRAPFGRLLRAIREDELAIAAAARQLIYGVLLIAFMLFRPQGLAGEKL
jgi:branched-chain amino acid transport system permease protein